MPYDIRRLPNGKYGIFRSDTGKKVGESTSKSKAEASKRARLAGEHNPNWKRKKR